MIEGVYLMTMTVVTFFLDNLHQKGGEGERWLCTDRGRVHDMIPSTSHSSLKSVLDVPVELFGFSHVDKN